MRNSRSREYCSNKAPTYSSILSPTEARRARALYFSEGKFPDVGKAAGARRRVSEIHILYISEIMIGLRPFSPLFFSLSTVGVHQLSSSSIGRRGDF